MDSLRSLGHHVAPTNLNPSAVLLCHMVNILVRYKHRMIALSIRTTTVTDVSARISRQTNYHQHLGHLVAPSDVNLLAILLCHMVNIPARYKHCKIALSISTTILTDVLEDVSADQVPSVLRASCSANQCKSLGSLTSSHRKYLGKIQALHKCIANQRYNYCMCLCKL